MLFSRSLKNFLWYRVWYSLKCFFTSGTDMNLAAWVSISDAERSAHTVTKHTHVIILPPGENRYRSTGTERRSPAKNLQQIVLIKSILACAATVVYIYMYIVWMYYCHPDTILLNESTTTTTTTTTTKHYNYKHLKQLPGKLKIMVTCEINK